MIAIISIGAGQVNAIRTGHRAWTPGTGRISWSVGVTGCCAGGSA